MTQPLRVGIVGCGVIAPTHIESFQAVPGVEVTWACDLLPDRAAATAKKYGIAKTTTNYTDLLADADLDIVSICTDHASHSPIAVDAFAAGKHVLCEKCLVASRPQLDAMLAAAAQRPDLTFAGIFQHRFDPVNRRLRELVQRGDLGEILTASAVLHCLRPNSYYDADDWHGTWAREGGSVLINQAIHFFDALQWIAGGVDAISAMYANRVHGEHIETEDTLTAALRFRSGALGTFEATSGSHLHWEFSLAVHGSLGSVELRNDQIVKLRCKDPDEEPRLRAYLTASEANEGVRGAADHYGTGHLAQVRDFCAAIRDGRPPFVTGQSAAETASLVLAAYESARGQCWVELTPQAAAAR